MPNVLVNAEITVIYDDNLDITDAVKAVTWSGDINRPYRTFTADINYTITGQRRALTFEHGREIRFIVNGAEVFRGVIFTFEIDSSGQGFVTAHDENVYLLKNNITRKVVNQRASALIRDICAEFGIATGSIADTGYVIPRLLFENKPIYDVFGAALEVTREQTGRTFWLYTDGAALQLAERRQLLIPKVLDASTNIIRATYLQSIEEMRNSIRIYGGDAESGEITAVARDRALIDAFGRMQHVEYVSPELTQAQIEQLAAQRLAELAVIDDEATVTALGDVDFMTGRATYVREPMTEIIGAYYIVADRHYFEGDLYTVDLTLSATDELPRFEYVPPAEETRRQASAEEFTGAGTGAGIDWSRWMSG